MARETTYQNADIYAKNTITKDVCSLALLPKKKSIFKTISNIRKKNLIQAIPNDEDIPEEFKKSLRNDLFL
jgi:hypothetical protein